MHQHAHRRRPWSSTRIPTGQLSWRDWTTTPPTTRGWGRPTPGGRPPSSWRRPRQRTLPLSDTPLTLIGGSPQQVTDAQRDLARIGIEPIAGATPGTPRGTVPPRASYPVSDFAGLAAVRRRQPVTVLDVRRRLEWSASHIEGAPHIPLHYLPGRLADLPPGPIWVHCQAGYPASD